MLWVAMAPNVHIPANKPAVAPHEVVVVGSAKKAARLAADINENSAAKPNVLPISDFFIWSSDKLLSFIHVLPNTSGLYHRPPTAKPAMAATKTAGQLINDGFIILGFKFNHNKFTTN